MSFGMRSLGATSLVAILGTGCIPIPIPPPTPYRADELQTAFEPIERLGRYHDGRFQAVAAAEVPPSHLYVLVHGWSPAWRGALEDNPRMRSWEAYNREGEAFEPWVPELAETILRTDRHAVVLAYSWLEMSATSALPFSQRRALARTSFQGAELARAVDASLGENFYRLGGQVHILGHSYGGRVATVAAVVAPKPPRHLTLFDVPDSFFTHVTGGQTELVPLLRKLPIGWGPGRVFVDNYVSAVGAQYHEAEGLSEIVDVMLAPPFGALDYSPRHQYPMTFYRQTNATDFGYRWSPLLSGARRPNSQCFVQRYDEIAIERACPRR